MKPPRTAGVRAAMSLPRLTDEDYRRMHRQGRHQELVEHHVRLALAIAARYGGKGLADEDLQSTALLALTEAVARFRPSDGAPLRHWAAMLVAQALVQELREEWERQGMMADADVDELLAPSDPAAEARAALEDLVESAPLNPRERLVLAAALHGRDYATAAAAELGVSIEAARQLKLRAMRKLRRHVGTDA